MQLCKIKKGGNSNLLIDCNAIGAKIKKKGGNSNLRLQCNRAK
jgi:hypothetical protein